ncbi:hypothetical protein ACFO0N_12505 [Halobium salinum]|uniref:DUF7835 domain-containing protein n=1 Tax=Halobium salinum TaxID=1364940 RepID=A0ABD5PCZ3_9EURY
MSSRKPPEADTEECTVCDTRTTHTVSIELVTESERERNAEFSREPYRVSECDVCGSEEKVRMNDA